MSLIIESLYFPHSQIYIDCVPIHVKHKENMFQISNKNLPTQFLHPTKGGGPKGPSPAGSKFFFFLELLYIFHFCSWAPSKTLAPFTPISLASLTQIATIKPKNLTKTIKTFTMMIVF